METQFKEINTFSEKKTITLFFFVIIICIVLVRKKNISHFFSVFLHSYVQSQSVKKYITLFNIFFKVFSTFVCIVLIRKSYFLVSFLEWIRKKISHFFFFGFSTFVCIVLILMRLNRDCLKLFDVYLRQLFMKREDLI